MSMILESGLDYYRARYYDSSVGRFVSVDPMGFGAGDTNLYRYVGNSSTNATDPSGMWINFAIGAAIGGVLDLGLQLWEQKGDFSKIDPTRLAISTISGALGGGIGGALGKGGALLKGVGSFSEHALVNTGLGLGARTTINAGVGFNLGYWGKVAENKIGGKEQLFDGALFTGIAGGAGAAVGELAQAGIGAAWSKHTRLDRVGRQLDDLAGETQDLIRQLDDLGAANQRLNVEWNVTQSRQARAGSQFGDFPNQTRPSLSPNPERLPKGNLLEEFIKDKDPVNQASYLLFS